MVEVFQENVFDELNRIAELVQTYNYVAMDTEFPGDVYSSNTHYQSLRENTTNLKLIQLGITLSDAQGNFAAPVCTWQFNFSFNLAVEPSNPKSIELLKKSGIDFEALATRGIDHAVFAEHLMSSGLIANPEVVWYGFHTDHDFAYLLKVLSGDVIPDNSEFEFVKLLNLYFPTIYDLKVMAEASMIPYLSGSLSKLSQALGVQRDDLCEHQAGSDSKITARSLFAFLEHNGMTEEMRKLFDCSKNEIYNINHPGATPSATVPSRSYFYKNKDKASSSRSKLQIESAAMVMYNPELDVYSAGDSYDLEHPEDMHEQADYGAQA